jgi:hypothetical protein
VLTTNIFILLDAGKSNSTTVPDSWKEAYQKAAVLVGQMTNAEKENITFGYTPSTGCAGESGSALRVGFPGLCLQWVSRRI